MSILLENGHLLRYGKLAEQTFGDGAGAAGHIQEFTFEGEPVWDYRFASTMQLGHHDIFKMPNGNVLMIVWDKKSPEQAVAAGRRPETVGQSQLLVDCIYEIQPTGKTTGKVVWEWHVWDHLIQDHDSSKANFGDVAAHPELVDINFGEGAIAAIVAKKEELEKLKAIGYIGSASPDQKARPRSHDWMHSNAVAYNAELDQVLLNVLEFNEFWIIDHSTTTAEAAGHTGGKYGKGGDLLYRWGNPRAYRAGTIKDQKLFGQHNTHWIPKGCPGEGHLLIFNNGSRRTGGATRRWMSWFCRSVRTGAMNTRSEQPLGLINRYGAIGAQACGVLCQVHFRSQPAPKWKYLDLLRSERNDLRSDSRKGNRLEICQPRAAAAAGSVPRLDSSSSS